MTAAGEKRLISPVDCEQWFLSPWTGVAYVSSAGPRVADCLLCGHVPQQHPQTSLAPNHHGGDALEMPGKHGA